MEAAGTTSKQDTRSDLPRLGLHNFWYPAARTKEIGKKPVAVKLLGEEVALFREEGKVYALHDRCPHRGMPLSAGWRYFPGTLTCTYHGWTFDTKGECVAALNEGPTSQLPGRVHVRTYPVEERNGVVWIFMGEGKPKPIEEDVPPELLSEKNIVNNAVEVWNCNWLPALENLMDSHDVFVHRNSLFYLFRKLPSWMKVGASELPDGKGIDYRYEKMGPQQDTFPRVGKWPRSLWWRLFEIDSPRPGDYPTAELRLPGMVRVGFSKLMYIRYMVPVDDSHVRAFLFSSRYAPGLEGISYRIYYRLWASWSLLKYFIGQDKVIFEKQDYSAPERLASTDVGVVKWRRLVAAFAKGETGRPAIWNSAAKQTSDAAKPPAIREVAEAH